MMKALPTSRDGGEHRCLTGPPFPGTADDSGVEPDRGSTAGRPRWVSVLGIVIAIGLVLLVVVLHLTGSIGPGAH